MIRVKVAILSIFLFTTFLNAQEYLTITLPITTKDFLLDIEYKIPLDKQDLSKQTTIYMEKYTVALVKEKNKDFLESTEGRKELKKELLNTYSKIVKHDNNKLYFTKFTLTPRKNKTIHTIDTKKIAFKKYTDAYNFLKNTNKIDINTKRYQQALLSAEEATKLNPNESKYWICYGSLLLHLQYVQDAQISAEVAAKIAINLNPKSIDKANMILLQSYINQFDFSKAISMINSILDKDSILINNYELLNTFVSIYAFSGEIDDGIDLLTSILNRHPTYYGAITAKIKLYQIQMKNTTDKDEIKEEINRLKKELNYIKSIKKAS